MSSSRQPDNPFDEVLQRVEAGAQNALDIMREGRLGAPYRAPFEVVAEHDVSDLRRYHPDEASADSPVVLMIPPLMVTSEIYDISPELSAVSFLAAEGLDVWLVDYGNPAERDDGLDRSLDDHILAVDRAVDAVVDRTNRPVHLVGYSQGGMFAYQAAAYRRAADIRSLVTFGAPVDIHRNLPVEMHDDIAERLIRAAHRGLSGPLEQLDGLPGWLTRHGFKLLNPGKELQHMLKFVGKLHDREALRDDEAKRLFLGGEGFIHWPGDALRDFLDDVIAENRMASGGFVVDGRTVSLADIDAPILYFAGQRDDLARPASVEAIETAAPDSDTRRVDVSAGHFGLVVGSTAMGRVWPNVAGWIDWHEDRRDIPPADLTDDDTPRDAAADSPTDAPAEVDDPPTPTDSTPARRDSGTRMLYDVATELIDGAWHRLGDLSREIGSVVDALRWQLPRMAQLESLGDDSAVNMGRALAEQARAIPEETVFVWEDRAFTYEEADVRVDRMAAALLAAGVEAGTHVGVLMDNHPDFLGAVAACSRIGAVSVLLNSGVRGVSLEQALEAGEVEFLIADAAHLESAREAFDGPVAGVDLDRGHAASFDPDGDPVVLDPALAGDGPDLPDGFEPNPGRGGDLAMLIFTSGTTGLPKAARITNRRWAMAALGTASACELTPSDTVYCALPLFHATGMLVAVGGALIGGSRLALSREFSVTQFWDEVRRYGATVVFYVGEMCRYLVNAPPRPDEHVNPVRLFVGNGLRPDVWRELEERFEPERVLEFYGSTEGNVCLANLTGEKVGSVGRPLPGTNELALVEYDAESGQPVRTQDGFLNRVDDGEPGLLLAEISDDHPLAHFDGYLDDAQTRRKVVEDAFMLGDAWFNTGDVLERDAEGDYWFVDRIGDTFRWSGENVSTEQVARIVRRAPGVAMAVVYGVDVPGYEGRAGTAAVVLESDADFDGDAVYETVEQHLFPAARPRFVRPVRELESTDSFKFVKTELKDEGVAPDAVPEPVWVIDPSESTYRPMRDDEWPPADL